MEVLLKRTFNESYPPQRTLADITSAMTAIDPKQTFIYRTQPTYNCIATKVAI